MCGLIWSIVNRYKNRGYSKEELYQIGCIGLIKSIQRFNTEFNVKISTFAVPYIIGEIKRFIRDDGPIKVSRSIKELATKISLIQQKCSENNEEDVPLDVLCEKLGADKEDVIVALEYTKPIQSIDEQVYDEDGESRVSKISIDGDETDSLVDKICIKELIYQLDDRDRQIIWLRYYKNKTQTEVAKQLGISQVQVSRIEKNILMNMRKKIVV